MLTAKETGARIKARRQDLGMTQDQLAEKIGYAVSFTFSQP